MFSQRRVEEAMALHREGRLDEAAAKYDALLALNPGDANLMNLQGILAGQRGDYVRALSLLNQAIAIDPAAPEFRNSVAVTCERIGDAAQAAAAFNDQGNLLMTARRFAEALKAFDHALRLRPDSPHYKCNRGVALLKLGRYESAVALLSSIPDGDTLSYIPLNLGNALTGLTRTTDAIAAYDRALSIEPGLVEAHFARGQALLLSGHYAKGWADYEWRKKWSGFDNPYRHIPEWTGEPLDGRLLVVSEQGLGDAIHFARYVPLLAEQGHDVVFEVRDELFRLFDEGFRHDGMEIVPRSAMMLRSAGAVAAHVTLLSLPRHFAVTVDSVAGDSPYLSASHDRAAAFARGLPDDGRFRVGLVRAGQPQHGNDFIRSLPPEAIEPLLSADAAFYSLQVMPFAVPGVSELGPGFTDFADTAAAILNMDLVISADTSVAHLAGALGRPVWLMIASAPDWRWGLGGDTTPWYPTARLFRQPIRGDWPHVVGEIRKSLTDLIDARKHG